MTISPRFLLTGAIFLTLVLTGSLACNRDSEKEGTPGGKKGPPPEVVKVVGPDTVAARFVAALAEGDFGKLRALSAGRLGDVMEEVVRRSRVNDTLYGHLKKKFPDLERETYNGMVGNTIRKRILEGTIKPRLDGFLAGVTGEEGARVYQVEFRDRHERVQYQRLQVARRDGQWRAIDLDGQHFNNYVKVWARNRNLLLENSLEVLALNLEANNKKVQTPVQAIQLFGQIAKQLNSEMNGAAK